METPIYIPYVSQDDPVYAYTYNIRKRKFALRKVFEFKEMQQTRGTHLLQAKYLRETELGSFFGYLVLSPTPLSLAAVNGVYAVWDSSPCSQEALDILKETMHQYYTMQIFTRQAQIERLQATMSEIDALSVDILEIYGGTHE